MTAMADPISGAKRRLLERLKRVDNASAAELAVTFDLTPAAVRQHLDDLAAASLVETVTDDTSGARGRGRPAQRWRLAPAAAAQFPDHHADLTVSLLEVIRDTMGDAGIDAVVDARTRSQLADYRATLPDPVTAPLAERVRALAQLRTVEGYMAEAVPVQDGDEGYLLIEHHCPICDAASRCLNLCRGELELFQAALGADVEVERVQHVLSGDQRCAYRVTQRLPRLAGA